MNIKIIEGTPAPPVVYGTADSPFGRCLIALCGEAICWLTFYVDEEEAIREFLGFRHGEASRDDGRIGRIARKIFSDAAAEIAVQVSGSPLQTAVWKALATIPFGQTVSYSELAAKAGKPLAVRAVATAIGKNNVSYLIPCHRVVRKNGRVGKYRWGTEVKKALLDWEEKEANR